MKALNNQVDSLQQKITQLESNYPGRKKGALFDRK